MELHYGLLILRDYIDFIVYKYTSVYSVKVFSINKEKNMSTKQGIHKLSLMWNKKYVCQM